MPPSRQRGMSTWPVRERTARSTHSFSSRSGTSSWVSTTIALLCRARARAWRSWAEAVSAATNRTRAPASLFMRERLHQREASLLRRTRRAGRDPPLELRHELGVRHRHGVTAGARAPAPEHEAVAVDVLRQGREVLAAVARHVLEAATQLAARESDEDHLVFGG